MINVSSEISRKCFAYLYAVISEVSVANSVSGGREAVLMSTNQINHAIHSAEMECPKCGGRNLFNKSYQYALKTQVSEKTRYLRCLDCGKCFSDVAPFWRWFNRNAWHTPAAQHRLLSNMLSIMEQRGELRRQVRITYKGHECRKELLWSPTEKLLKEIQTGQIHVGKVVLTPLSNGGFDLRNEPVVSRIP